MSNSEAKELTGTLRDTLALLVDRLDALLNELDQQDQQGPASCGTDEVAPPGGWLQ